MKIIETDKIKVLQSPKYNYLFRKTDGFFARWGATKEEDPVWSPFGPEIADIELTTACNAMCPWCYKANTPKGKFMSLETFKRLLDVFPSYIDEKGTKRWHVNQIAFGVDSECKTNPEVFDIFKYCRENGIVPNLTVAHISDDTASKIAQYAGACAVSRYSNKNHCYDAIDLLTNKYNMRQVNIHQLVTAENLHNIMETLSDIKTDPRLKKLNAIVFLMLKKKGRGVGQTVLPSEKYAEIIRYCRENGISYGSDSCGAHKLMSSLDSEERERLKEVIEDCESTRFSMYIDVNARFFPCSFMANENLTAWKDGIDMLGVKDFMSEVWNHPYVSEFRKQVITSNKNSNGCCYFRI